MGMGWSMGRDRAAERPPELNANVGVASACLRRRSECEGRRTVAAVPIDSKQVDSAQ